MEGEQQDRRPGDRLRPRAGGKLGPPLPACLLRGPGSRGTKRMCNSQCRVTQRKHSRTPVTRQEPPAFRDSGQGDRGAGVRALRASAVAAPPFCTRAAISPLREGEHGDLRAQATWSRSRGQTHRCPRPVVSPRRRARRKRHPGDGVRTSASENDFKASTLPLSPGSCSRIFFPEL